MKLINFLKWQKNNALSGQGVNALQFSHLGFDASFQDIFGLENYETNWVAIFIRDGDKNDLGYE